MAAVSIRFVMLASVLATEDGALDGANDPFKGGEVIGGECESGLAPLERIGATHDSLIVCSCEMADLHAYLGPLPIGE